MKCETCLNKFNCRYSIKSISGDMVYYPPDSSCPNYNKTFYEPVVEYKLSKQFEKLKKLTLRETAPIAESGDGEVFELDNPNLWDKPVRIKVENKDEEFDLTPPYRVIVDDETREKIAKIFNLPIADYSGQLVAQYIQRDYPLSRKSLCSKLCEDKNCSRTTYRHCICKSFRTITGADFIRFKEADNEIS